MTRITYPIAFKLEALKLLETLSDYKVAALLNVARRALRYWQKQRNELLAYKGNKKRLKVRPGGRPEQFPDPPGLVQYINDLRDAERAHAFGITLQYLYFGTIHGNGKIAQW
ncbi:hypothetical protein H257_08887 [Aphanomyces astaci]|uniref:Uncharacterized protein n=1 Tax=Aphanomyces astaci TaxID=112090 RepID=W4GCR4_APHAT|nr:hypothetical protein H257_08887 [Aphanomyces astaci]ETV77477.1 hypothetical protein H257_08887 [Aphanomyces astaci]|eukprot:XP_009833264.1 hypothetical protein H257_08887 [Aphanomyces astaci]